MDEETRSITQHEIKVSIGQAFNIAFGLVLGTLAAFTIVGVLFGLGALLVVAYLNGPR